MSWIAKRTWRWHASHPQPTQGLPLREVRFKAFDIRRSGDMGIYFLALVVLLTFVYLGFALFRPEKF